MISGDERDLFARTVEHALATGADLASVGWADALGEDRRAAVSILFEAQGRLGATSTALELVLAGAAVTRADVAALDPRLGPVPLSVDDPEAERVGRLALAHELVGASRAMLAMACDHARGRVQFDRPIAGFQAVRHRLAEALVAVEAAAGAAEAAWDDGSSMAAAAAKALAGRGGRVVARHCQQVCAGIGFTLEHPLHRYVRRVLTLDRALGDHRTLTRQLGEQLLAAGAVPPLLPL